LVGCGATGSVLASLVVRAGIGSLRIIDRDFVELSNLQRQVLFDERDAEQSLPKAAAAAQKLSAANSEVVIEPHVADLTPANAAELLDGCDLLLDGSDNFETRYLINDFAVQNGVPWIYSGAVGSYCATMNVLPGESACLACMFPTAPRGQLETCDTAGILNSAASAVASIAATEALKVLAGRREAVRKTLLSFDLWTGARAELAATRRADCAACVRREFLHLRGENRAAITMCGRNSVQIHERNSPIDFLDLETRLRSHGSVRHNDFVLKFWRDPYEITIFRDGRAIIKGTTDTGVARSLYARYIGC
jgi:adenylyltransferase/sulfurtransferase